MSNRGEKRINALELARPHDKYVADLGKRAQNTGRHAESEGKNRKSHISVLGSRTAIRFLREATSCSASLWAEELGTGFATCLTTKGIASITLFHTN